MRTPYIARASGRPYAAGSMLSFDTSFLRSHPPMDAPEIAGLRLRFTGSVTVAAGKTVAGKALIGEICNRIFLNDARGDVVNAATYTLRQWAQRTLGAGYTDPDDLAAGAAQPVDIQLYIPFEMRRAQIPSDWRKPVEDIAGQGGQIRIQCGSGALTATDGDTASVVLSGTVEIWAYIVDAGTRRATSRLQLRDYGVNGQDFRYPVEGLLLDAWLSAQPADIAQTIPLAAQSFISDGLYYTSYDSTVLNDTYKNQLFSLSANDDVVDGVAHSFHSSMNYQSQAELPDLELVQVRLSTAAPTNGQVCIASVTQRSPVQTAAALGIAPSQLPAAQASAQTEGKSGTQPYSSGGKLSFFLPAKVGAKVLGGKA